jgi:hypothetical protein
VSVERVEETVSASGCVFMKWSSRATRSVRNPLVPSTIEDRCGPVSLNLFRLMIGMSSFYCFSIRSEENSNNPLDLTRASAVSPHELFLVECGWLIGDDRRNGFCAEWLQLIPRSTGPGAV